MDLREQRRLIDIDAGPLAELTRYEAEKAELEAVPPPEKTKVYTDSQKEEEKKRWENELNSKIDGPAKEVVRATSFNPSLPGKHPDEIDKLQNKEPIKCLWPLFKLATLDREYDRLNEEHYQLVVLQLWKERFQNNNSLLKLVRERIGRAFSPELINVDPKFPAARCQMADGRYYDVWLSNDLGGKKIFFDAKDYKERLMEWREKIFEPQMREEQARERRERMA